MSAMTLNPPRRSDFRVGLAKNRGLIAIVVVFACLLLFVDLISPVSLGYYDINSIISSGAALALASIGQTFVILVGGFDLSAGAVISLVNSFVATTPQDTVAAQIGVVFAGLAVGAAVGLVNGLLIVKGRLNGFIVTLGMTILLAGIQEGIVKGESPFALPNAFSYLGSAYWGKIPVSLIVTAVIFVLTGLFLRYHRTGRAIYAIGGNREAARAAGIKVNRVRMGVYVAGSVLAAIGGLMEAGRVSSVASTQGYGEGIIFAVFAAAVIGGVSLQGGRGNMVGAASGVVLLGVVQNILFLENAPNYWIDAIDGGVILFALILARVIGGEASAE